MTQCKLPVQVTSLKIVRLVFNRPPRIGLRKIHTHRCRRERIKFGFLFEANKLAAQLNPLITERIANGPVQVELVRIRESPLPQKRVIRQAAPLTVERIAGLLSRGGNEIVNRPDHPACIDRKLRCERRTNISGERTKPDSDIRLRPATFTALGDKIDNPARRTIAIDAARTVDDFNALHLVQVNQRDQPRNIAQRRVARDTINQHLQRSPAEGFSRTRNRLIAGAEPGNVALQHIGRVFGELELPDNVLTLNNHHPAGCRGNRSLRACSRDNDRSQFCRRVLCMSPTGPHQNSKCRHPQQTRHEITPTKPIHRKSEGFTRFPAPHHNEGAKY